MNRFFVKLRNARKISAPAGGFPFSRRTSPAATLRTNATNGKTLMFNTAKLLTYVLILNFAGSSHAENVRIVEHVVCLGERVKLGAGSSWTAQTPNGAIGDLTKIAVANYEIVFPARYKETDIVRTRATVANLVTARGGSLSTTSTFYFSVPGLYRLTITRPDAQQYVVDLRVKAPIIRLVRRAVGEISMTMDDGAPELEFGGRLEGVNIDYSIDMNNCAGEIADVQVNTFVDIDGYDPEVSLRGQPTKIIRTTEGRFALDFDPAIWRKGWIYDYREAHGHNDRFFKNFNDSPGSGLADKDIVCTSTRDLYRYFVMFRSSKANSIWVPAGEFEWSLEMFAHRADNRVNWFGGNGVKIGGRASAAKVMKVGAGLHWPLWQTYTDAIPELKTEQGCWHGRGG